MLIDKVYNKALRKPFYYYFFSAYLLFLWYSLYCDFFSLRHNLSSSPYYSISLRDLNWWGHIFAHDIEQVDLTQLGKCQVHILPLLFESLSSVVSFPMQKE